MAVTTRVQPRYTFRMVAIALVSVGLGVWGVLDYAVFIPRQELLYHRGQVVSQQVLDALVAARADEADQARVRQEMTKAAELISAEVTRLVEVGHPEAPAEQSSDQPATIRIEDHDEAMWLQSLHRFQQGLVSATRRELSEEDEQTLEEASTLASSWVTQTSNISPPGALDRYVKGLLFIPCLPIGLLMLWPVYRASKKRYVLEDDGTLRTPEGDVAPEEIAEIDMTRWMAKSVAYVVTSDGRRIKLDDYVHKNVDVIVGTIASQKLPDEWTADARPKTVEEVSSEAIEQVSEEAEHPAA